MDVYDTNVWIFGLTTNDTRASQLIEQVVAGDRHVVINAYIYKEVVRNLYAGADSDYADQAINSFAEIVFDSDYVDSPTHEDVASISVPEVRSSRRVCMIAHAIGCQPKDAPVIEAAYRRANQLQEQPTIFTNDGKSDDKEDGLVNVDLHRFRETDPATEAIGDGGYNPTQTNPLGLIQTEFVPEPN